MKKNSLSVLFALVFVLSSSAQARLKVLFQNMLNYSTSSKSIQKTPYVKTILNEIQPDLFMVCEMVNESASNYLFTNAILTYNEKFGKANFKYSQSPATGLHQMVYYNTEKFKLENTQVIPTETRDINHYTFVVKTENGDTNPIKIEVFVTHLKASTGSENREKRKNSISKFTKALTNLPSNSFVLFAGDFNFYTSNEAGYQQLIRTDNAIVMVDPINRPCPDFPNDGVDYFYYENYNSTYFWNNASFKDIHTQSTRNNSVEVIDNSGATGGMDDRFDFIMMSENFNSNSDLYYIDGSYKAVGNNGNCYNTYVANTTCTGEYSQNLREAIMQVSDHLPVFMEIETTENLLSVNDISKAISVLGSNVVTENLEVSLNDLEAENIYIYNQLGQLFLKQSVRNRSKIRLNVKHFANGLYFLRTDKHLKALKFIKH